MGLSFLLLSVFGSTKVFYFDGASLFLFSLVACTYSVIAKKQRPQRFIFYSNSFIVLALTFKSDPFCVYKWCEVGIWLHSFAYEYIHCYSTICWVVLYPAEDQLTVNMRVLWALKSIPFIYVSPIPVPHYLVYYGFVLRFGIGKCESFNCVLFQDSFGCSSFAFCM